MIQAVSINSTVLTCFHKMCSRAGLYLCPATDRSNITGTKLRKSGFRIHFTAVSGSKFCGVSGCRSLGRETQTFSEFLAALTGQETQTLSKFLAALTGAGNPNSALLRLGSSNRFAITFYLSVSLRRIWNGPAFCWLRRQYQEYL